MGTFWLNSSEHPVSELTHGQPLEGLNSFFFPMHQWSFRLFPICCCIPRFLFVKKGYLAQDSIGTRSDLYITT